MDVDEEAKPRSKIAAPGRSMTPAQRKLSISKLARSKTAERREGSEPKRLPFKLVPEEQVRLSKKIMTKEFGRKMAIHEADRHIGVKRPKHLYAGKMSNGKRDYR